MQFQRLAVAVVALHMAVSSQAEVKPAAMFSDDMVLQRDKVVPVWGWAATRF